MTLDQQFNTINEKLQQLLKQYSRLQKENERLKEELLIARNKEMDWKARTDELQQQVSIMKLATGEMNEKEKKDFEKKINQYVKEIDKCISFLSQ
jgi:predicted nuclease with TOPRIM domain